MHRASVYYCQGTTMLIEMGEIRSNRKPSEAPSHILHHGDVITWDFKPDSIDLHFTSLSSFFSSPLCLFPLKSFFFECLMRKYIEAELSGNSKASELRAFGILMRHSFKHLHFLQSIVLRGPHLLFIHFLRHTGNPRQILCQFCCFVFSSQTVIVTVNDLSSGIPF